MYNFARASPYFATVHFVDSTMAWNLFIVEGLTFVKTALFRLHQRTVPPHLVVKVPGCSTKQKPEAGSSMYGMSALCYRRTTKNSRIRAPEILQPVNPEIPPRMSKGSASP